MCYLADLCFKLATRGSAHGASNRLRGPLFADLHAFAETAVASDEGGRE